ncbi:lysine/arginine/ornithine ABC transporter substrate-binding protein [Novispirillum itersonii]|uniref:lysine/arginine/ornithine ABC transporter substrate-binding protein n=1 Tax=Novispirillum itersonii TaxID=189 RepID=UPI00037C1903|nr:lysine/arginine/ornithine ABC transporter substrate-binding protein [Novispirillum itersonii]
MKKSLFGFAAASIIALSAAAHAAPKEVRIGTEAAYAPFEFVDPSGKIVGFEVELGDAICAAAELKCVWSNVPFDALIPQLMEKKIDGIMSSMSITEKRRKSIDFTSKYFQVPNAFVAKKGTAIELTKEGLKGKKVGVQSGTTNADYLKKYFDGVVEVVRYQTQEEVNMDLVNGRLDAMVVDSVIGTEWFKTDQGKDYALASPMLKDPVFGEGVGVGLRKGETELKAAFEKGVSKVLADGTAQKLSLKWFGVDIYK